MFELKVLMVAHTFPPYVGGLAHVVENLSTALVTRGFEVEVVTLKVGRGLPEREVYRGVAVRRFRGYAPDGGYFIPSPGFYEYLKKTEADIFHLHNIGALTVPAAYLAIRRKDNGYVLTPHYHKSGYKWHAKLLWKLYRPFARKIVKDANLVHCVSEYEASLVRSVFGVRKPIIIPNGVSNDVFDHRWAPPRNIVLTYAGRVEGYKRVGLLVDAAYELSRRGHEDVVVKVIGLGPDLPRLKRKAEELRVELVSKGFLPRDEYLRELATSTALVNMSEYEAYSIVSAEAIAMGVPVVVAKPWGEHFKKYGKVYVVNPRPGEIADAIEAIMEGGQHDTAKTEGVPRWSEVAERLIKEVYLRVARR